MDSETMVILEQLSGAVDTARTAKRMVYVFNDDGWCISGKLPAYQKDFYIVYADGEYDKTGSVPEICASDWTKYLSENNQRFVPIPDLLPERKVILKPQKKIFLAYCAFAPQIALAACVVVCYLFNDMERMWPLALPVVLICVPLTLVFALGALHRAKSEKVGIIATSLAIEGHFAFYMHTSAIAAGVAREDLFIITVIGSLICSGLALLFTWDNELPEPAVA